MDREDLLLQFETRRHFFSRCGVGLGKVALACAAEGSGPLRRTGARRPHACQARALSGQGEERDLPVHGRRAQPVRAVRFQAGAAEVQRPAGSRLDHGGQALRLHGLVRQGHAEAAGHAAAPFKQHGNSGAWVSDLLPHIASVADDITLSERCLHRELQSRAGEVLHEHRLDAVRPAQHGLLGHLRHRQRIAGPAGISSCCNPDRAARAAARLCGRAGSCPPPTRAFRSVRAATRSSISPGRRASRPKRSWRPSRRFAT